jgi:uncharacterized protein (TIGR02145 family)
MKTTGLFFFPLRRAKSRRDGTLLTVCFSLRTFSLRAILLPALTFFFCANLSAQVTMGGLEEPKSGAILDLNSTVKGGLLLSNVVLDNLYTIPTAFPGMSTPPVDVNEKFTGALIYHEGGNGIPAGIYVWNGTNWSPATENCTAPALTLTASKPFVRIDETVVFSVSSDASPRCAKEDTYEWFVSEDNGSTYSFLESGATASTSFASVGDYRVKVSAVSPYSSDPVEKEVDISVTADGGPAPNMLTYTYGIVGETCLDVKKSAQGKSAAVFNARTDAFEGGFTKEYKFVHGNSYTDLNLSCIDDPTVNIVADITSPPASVSTGAGEQTITVTFKSNVKDLVPLNGDSLTVRLLASYKPQEDPTATKYAWLEIRVEDGTCVCPAKINTGPDTWLNFMCHNLGGLDIISSSQLITREHLGDWYRYGAKNASMKNTPAHDTDNNTWDNVNYYSSGNWPDNVDANIGNPCPAGWKIPGIGELSAVITEAINPLSNVPASWLPASNQTFSNLKKSGDYLYLPANGERSQNNGALSGRGASGSYWSNTSQASYGQFGYYMNASGVGANTNSAIHGYGMSVRCVQAE